MNLPTWTLVAVFFSAFIHGLQFMVVDAGMCEGEGLPDTGGNALEVIQAFASFTACEGGMTIFTFALFVIGTLPLLLLLALFLFQLFSNAITGAVVGALAVVVGLIALFA